MRQNSVNLLQRGLSVAVAVFACAALQAKDHDKKSGEAHGDKTAQFIQKAAQSGQMELKVAQLGQQKAQNAEVKRLAQALQSDHSEANRELERIAQSKNIRVTKDLENKHSGKLDKLNSASGADFDKEFVMHAMKHHKKDISKFEKASKDITDAELKAFIDKTLPKLRQHLAMAQGAARSLGVPDTAFRDLEDDDMDREDAGAPAAGEIERKYQSDDIDKHDNTDKNASIQSDVRINNDRYDGAVQSDRSLTINQNSPAATADGSARVDIDADLDRGNDDPSIRTDVDVDTDTEKDLFREGDGKTLGIKTVPGDDRVLGLNTSKSDGKLLGIIPLPDKDNDADAEARVDVDTDRDLDVGGPGVSVSGRAGSEQVTFNELPSSVKSAIRSKGGTDTVTVKRMTVYETEINGKTVHIADDGKVFQHDDHDDKD